MGRTQSKMKEEISKGWKPRDGPGDKLCVNFFQDGTQISNSECRMSNDEGKSCSSLLCMLLL